MKLGSIQYVIILILKKKTKDVFLKFSQRQNYAFLPNWLGHGGLTPARVNFKTRLDKESAWKVSRLTHMVDPFFSFFFQIPSSSFFLLIESFLFFFQFHLSIFGWFEICLHNLFRFASYDIIVASHKYLSIWLELNFTTIYFC